MLNKEDIRGWNALDEAAERAGGYLAKPKRPLIIEYDYRAMTKYCREKGIAKADLTEEELKLFEYAEPLVYN
jgi:carbamoylphosphate synthase small subunit